MEYLNLKTSKSRSSDDPNSLLNIGSADENYSAVQLLLSPEYDKDSIDTKARERYENSYEAPWLVSKSVVADYMPRG